MESTEYFDVMTRQCRLELSSTRNVYKKKCNDKRMLRQHVSL